MSFRKQMEHNKNNKKEREFRTERSSDALHASLNQISVPEIRRTCRGLFSAGAGLTVEAAIALPLVIMAVWFLIFPLRIMETERIVQNRMETTARALAISAYLREAGERKLQYAEKYADTVDSALELAEEGVALASVLSIPETKLLSMLRFGPETSVLSDAGGQDPDIIHLELEYELALPSAVFSVLPVHKSLIVHRRAWTGSEGGRGRDVYGARSGETDAADPIVYVGKNSTRYHEDPHCHYLSNQMKTADASEMGGLRNAGGARYHACPSCKPGETGTVWYFESGTAYHSSESCKAITAYGRAVPLSEVKHLGPCSYCSKKP